MLHSPCQDVLVQRHFPCLVSSSDSLCRNTAALRVPWGLNLSSSCISRLQRQKERPGSPTMPPTVARDKTLRYQLSGMRQQQRKPLQKILIFKKLLQKNLHLYSFSPQF